MRWRGAITQLALTGAHRAEQLERLRSKIDAKPSYRAGIGAVFDECMALLDRAPVDVLPRLLRSVELGEIDGGEQLNCLRGTLARHCGKGYDAFANPDTRGGEWFYLEGFLGPVAMGQTPETSPRLRRVAAWIEEYTEAAFEAAVDAGDMRAVMALAGGDESPVRYVGDYDGGEG
jgi:hypothetical protein